MVTGTQAETILRVEKQFWDAMLRKDAAAAERLTSERCIIVGAQGVSAIDRKTMAKLTREGQWTLERYEFDEDSIQVQMLNERAAVIAYKVTEQVVVDGRQMTLEANDSSVWQQQQGDWLCVLHTESVAGDPFGRDRRGGT